MPRHEMDPVSDYRAHQSPEDRTAMRTIMKAIPAGYCFAAFARLGGSAYKYAAPISAFRAREPIPATA
jgi:hypothetical protein